MLSWLIRRKIDAFEEDFSYDMAYVRELLDTSPEAMMLYHKATRLGEYRQDLPKAAWYAAKLVSLRAEDCGPCTQLMVTMAERDGQSPEMLRSVLRDELDGLPEDVRLAVVFTQAILQRDPVADELRPRALQRFGRRGLVSLAFAMLSSRLYPTLKYALGYGRACSVIHVDGAPVLTPGTAH